MKTRILKFNLEIKFTSTSILQVIQFTIIRLLANSQNFLDYN